MTLGVSFQNGIYVKGGASANVSTTKGGTKVTDFFNEEYLAQRNSYQDKKESYDLQRTSRDAAINTKVSKVISHLKRGQEDKPLDAYNELLEVMASQERYSTFAQNDAELRAIARQFIEANLDGETLEDVIRKNTRTHGRVEQQNLLTWGNCDHTSQETLLAEMCDIDEDETGGNIIVDGLAILASPFVWLGNAIFGGGGKM